MKGLIIASTALLVAGLTFSQTTSAIDPPDKIIYCKTNPHLVIHHWNMLHGILNNRSHLQCPTPHFTGYWGDCTSMTPGAYYAQCGWDTKPAEPPKPAEPVKPTKPAPQPRK